MAVVLSATLTPIAFAARNEVVPFLANTDAIANIRNPFSNIFLVGNPTSAWVFPRIAAAIADALLFLGSAMERTAKGSIVPIHIWY
ncbi:hypothetical protein REPUB_Repub03eG0178000 [Reevesia pubescens]